MGSRRKSRKEYQIKLEDMPETSEFIKFDRITSSVIESMFMAFLS